MSIFKKVSAFLTAVGIACSCAACGYNTVNALTVDGYTVPAGVYIYYANTAYNEALNKLKEDNADLDTTDTKAVRALTLEGKDVLTWVQDEATKHCAEFVVIEQKFDELGLELDAESKSNISMMKDYYWANSQESFERNGISESSFEKIVTSSYKNNMIYDHYYGIDGENGVTEEDAYNYYKENNIRAEYLAISLKDGEGNLLKSDGKAEMMEMAKDYQKRAEDALKEGGIDAVKAEMDSIREDYSAYVASLTATEEEATGDAAAEETTEAVTEAETTADTTAEGETTSAEDETAAETEAETETTAAQTGEGEVAAETFNAPADTTEAETEDAAAETETETTAEADAEDADETTEATEDADEDDTTEETDDTTEETEEASDEDGEDDALPEEAAEEEADPYANETIISVIHEEDYDDPEDIYYNPSEKTYNKLLEIGEKDYGKVYIVEEDENYYLAVRYDIEDRMTADDLWSESGIDNAVFAMHSKDFEDMVDEWANAANVQRNEAAYKRYDPFKFDFN